MENELLSLKNKALSIILESNSRADLEEMRIRFLGRNGELAQLFKQITKLPAEEKPRVGKTANEVKTIIEDTFREQELRIKKQELYKTNVRIDVTEPGIKPPLGHLHLVTQAIREITKIFEHIGFTRVCYPEIEWDWYPFTALNFPENHPARDDWETFFIKQNPDPKLGPVVLTPHTSSGQIREMEKQVARSQTPSGSPLSGGETRNSSPDKGRLGGVNIRMLNIAKCYRRQIDVSHTPMFHQFETLVIGEKISVAHLKGVLDYFVKSYFGEHRRARIRPYHFQFTEPSFETDVSCGVCDGKGCKLCKEGWLELGGAGMVHPNVLRNSGLDPKKYTGFASGWGVERVLMMKEGIQIDDLRTLYSNDLDFLEQF